VVELAVALARGMGLPEEAADVEQFAQERRHAIMLPRTVRALLKVLELTTGCRRFVVAVNRPDARRAIAGLGQKALLESAYRLG